MAEVSSASPFPAAPGMGDGEESAKDCAAERPTAKKATSVEQARIEKTYREPVDVGHIRQQPKASVMSSTNVTNASVIYHVVFSYFGRTQYSLGINTVECAPVCELGLSDL